MNETIWKIKPRDGRKPKSGNRCWKEAKTTFHNNFKTTPYKDMRMQQSIATLFLLASLLTPSLAFSSHFEMIPGGDKRFVDEGTFNIICRLTVTNYPGRINSSYAKNITWDLPTVFHENEMLRTRRDHDRQNTNGGPPYNITNTYTLTVYNATSKDTGLYRCRHMLTLFTVSITKSQYIYINDKEKSLVTLATYETTSLNLQQTDALNDIAVERMEIDEGPEVTIPCRATRPFVEVSFSHRTFAENQTLSEQLKDKNQFDVIKPSSANLKYAYNHHTELIVKLPRPSDSGIFKCSGSLGDTTSDIFVLFLVQGLDLTIVGGNDEIEEESNVTFVCISFDFNSPKFKPTWRYAKKLEKTNFIDEERPPEGETASRNILYCKHLIGLSAELESLQVKISHETFLNEFRRSTLQLFNVTRQLNNNYFECIVPYFSKNRELSNRRKGISIRFKNKEKNVENIFIEMDKNETLTCVTKEPASDFQWFKDKQPVSMTGKLDAHQLKLNGVPGDAGLYECRYRDKYGDQRHKTFVVAMASDSNNQMITVVIISVTVLLAFIAVVIGILWFFHSRKKVFPDAEKLLKGIKLSNDYDIRRPEDDVCAQPYDKRLEFPRNRLIIGEKIGAGCFGKVMKGQAIGINKEAKNEPVSTVAVKMIKTRCLDASRELESLITELKTLIYLGSHINVVRLLGACTKNISRGEFLLILEYCRFGNLHSFLNNPNHMFNDSLVDDGYLEALQLEGTRCSTYLPMRDNEHQNPRSSVLGQENVAPSTSEAQLNDGNVVGNSVPFRLLTGRRNSKRSSQCETSLTNVTYSTRDLISWSWQITRGMGHLTSKKVVHGDLAARNVLMADNGLVKVADFGLARQLYYKEYYQKEGKGPLPVKWMAIESLMNGIFTSQSDVWSYGVVLWELFSLGKIPYPGIDGKRMLNELESGFRMDKPTGAPDFIGEMMTSCWEAEPAKRPTFEQLENTLFKNLHFSVRSYYLQFDITA